MILLNECDKLTLTYSTFNFSAFKSVYCTSI